MGCSSVATALYPGFQFDTPTLLKNGFYFPLTEGKDGSNSGQFGVALRLPIEAIDSEWGLYGMRINSRTPIISAYTGTWGPVITNPASPAQIRALRTTLNPIPAQQAALGARFGVKSAAAFWEYPDDIDIFGTTLSTNIAGWSVGAEFGYTRNQPVQVNGNDILYSAAAGVGPLAAADEDGDSTGRRALTFRVTTASTRASCRSIPSRSCRACSGRRRAYSSPKSPDSGRRIPTTRPSARVSAMAARSSSDWDRRRPAPSRTGNTCNPANRVWNPQRDGCNNDGYATSTAWGYRLKASLDYTGAFDTGFTLTPSVFWSHDVSGYSVDTQFIEDRMILGLGLRADYQKKYTIDLGYTAFLDKAKYDPFKDRDYLSLAFSTTF